MTLTRSLRVAQDIFRHWAEEKGERWPEGEYALPKRQKFDFEMLDVPRGAILEFKGQEKITCEVACLKPPKVRYGDEIVTLSVAAQKAGRKSYQMRGPDYWTFQGELLSKRRERLEEQPKPADKAVTIRPKKLFLEQRVERIEAELKNVNDQLTRLQETLDWLND